MGPISNIIKGSVGFWRRESRERTKTKEEPPEGRTADARIQVREENLQ